MSNYTQSTNFATKDALSSGDPLKIVKGTEINTEFVNISVAIATKADLASPTFTGSPVLPTGTTGTTQSAGNSSTALATTAFVTTADNLKADLASPALTGTPTAPTASVNTNTTQVATTAYVVAQIADDAPTKTGSGASGTWNIAISGNASTASTASTVSSITTDQVLNATAGASLGAVGTYAFLVRNGDAATLSAGSTAAGSGLIYGSVISVNYYNYNTAVDGGSTTSPAGTWRLMGEFARGSDATKASLWLRIS
jgi:hypothetical protein